MMNQVSVPWSMLLNNGGNIKKTQPQITPEPSHANASTRRVGTPSKEETSRSLAIARIAVPVAVCFKKMLTTTTTRIAKPNAASCVVVTTPPPMVNRLLGNSSVRGLEVSHRSFMTPSNSKATPSVPSDFTNGSRLAKNGAMHTPYANVSPAHTITSIG